MANSISKSSILAFLNNRLEERSNNVETTKGKYFYLNEGATSMLFSLITNIEQGMFDYSDELEVSAQMYTNNKKFNELTNKYKVYPNGAMIDKKITSNY